MQLIDHLLSSYGLISGDVSEVVEGLVSDKSETFKFEISRDTNTFIDAITFLSPLEEIASKHLLFQHSPDWTTMLSNSSELGSFYKYQEDVSKLLNCKTIGITDLVSNKNFNKIFEFRMLDENGETVRNISSISKGAEFNFKDEGEGFGEFSFKSKIKQKEFDSYMLSELIRKATKYDESLDQGLKKQFYLIEEIVN